MARLLKEPVKKKGLKGVKKGLRITQPQPPTPGRINKKNGKGGK